MENVFTEETCKSCLQEDPQLIPNSVLHLSEYQGEKKIKKLKNLSAASLSSSTRNLFPSLCIPSKIPSTLTLTTYLSTLAPVCLSSHRERSHSGRAVKGSIESSPRPAPCHHVDPTTQHNSETNLTFSPTSRIYPPRKSQAVSGKEHGSGFLENNQTTQPPEVLPLPLLPPAIHHCCEWSSQGCLSVFKKQTKKKRVIKSCQISVKGTKLFLFSFKSWLAEYLPTLCMVEFKTEKADTDQQREYCNAFTSLCLFCCSVTTEWRAGSALVPPQTCSQTVTNGERGGRGQERIQTCATTVT